MMLYRLAFCIGCNVETVTGESCAQSTKVSRTSSKLPGSRRITVNTELIARNSLESLIFGGKCWK